MATAPFDFAILGATPLASLLAGLLAAEHGKRVCIAGEFWTPLQLTRRFDLSVMPVTRPETWTLLRDSSIETLKLLGGIGKSLYERVDPLFIAETPASIAMLGHLRHVALGLGIAAERVTDPAIVAEGAGCRIRDGALLVPQRAEPALANWLDSIGVRRLQSAATEIELRRDGSAVLSAGAAELEAAHAVLADDDAILAFLSPERLDRALRPYPVTSVFTEPARPLRAPLMQFLDRGVTLGQRGRKGAVIALAGGSPSDALLRIGSTLSAQGRLRRVGQAQFRTLATLDGAPLVGLARHPRVTMIAGLGDAGAFFAPALARLLAERASAEEQAYFAPRQPAPEPARQAVSDYAIAGLAL